ncbi:MAG: hypothetical protein WCR55_08860 [Lentisphaerota bacterium]
MKGRGLLTLGAFLVSSMLLAEGVSVNTMTLQTIAPKDIYFTGKVMSTEGGNLAFAVDRGVIDKTKKVGDVVFPNIYNDDGTIARKGSVVGKIINFRQIAAYAAAQDTYDREVKSGKAFSSLLLEQDKNKALSAKADLDATECIAPYTGVVTNIQRGPGMGVGGAGDDFATIARMDPMIVKIPFASEIVNLIGKDNVIKVYPLGQDKPVAAWIELNPADQFSVYAFVENEIIPDLTWLTPEQIALPKVYGLFPVRHFYDEQYLTKIQIEKDSVVDNLTPEQQSTIAVPAVAIFSDKDGDFVYRAKGQKAFSLDKGVSIDFNIEKVPVKKGTLMREFNYGTGAALNIVSLADAGTLTADDVLCVYLDKGLKNGDHVAYARTKWLFLPGDQVPVQIPDIVQPGFFVPTSVIIHASESGNFVYVVDSGKAKIVRVQIDGRAWGAYSITGDGIKEGTKLVVFDDKSILDNIYDGAAVTEKGSVPPPKLLEKKRVLPLTPVEQFAPYSFFN